MIKRQKNLNKFRVTWDTSSKISDFWVGNFFNRKKKKRWLIYQVWHISANPHLRIKFLLFFILVIFWIIVSRLFYLQIIKWEYYNDLAFNQQYSKIELPARRWEIFATNSKTWELQKLATNISLDLVYIDPNFIPNKEKVAKELSEILFTEEDYKDCKEDIRLCPKWTTVKFDEKITLQEKPVSWTWDIILKDSRSMEELKKDYADDILRKISKKYIDYLPLKYWASDDEIKQVKELWISWLSVLDDSKTVYINPTEINQEKISDYSKKIIKIFSDKKKSQIELYLTKRVVQYVPLKRKISPEISEKIRELKNNSYEEYKKNFVNKEVSWEFYEYKWIVLLKEHWRYYPEKDLASQVVWFVDNEWIWRYWIEEYFNEKLSWKNWIIFNKKNVRWEFIFLDNKKFSEVKDWESVVLTIDKIIQKEVEKFLEEWVKSYWADKWQVIVMNPKTWEILAMASYPNFDPNEFWEVYEIIPIKEDFETDEEKKENPEIFYTQPLFVKNSEWKYEDFNYTQVLEENEKIEKAIENWEEPPERIQKYIYKNRIWLNAYVNHTVSSLYEPWSVFKPFIVAAWVDSGEVEPSTTYEEFWPIEVDTWTSQKQYIRTALNVYRWIQTITNALEYSSNIWMAFVARKLWAQLSYYYIKRFNFWEIYWIEQNWEKAWIIEFWKKWNEAKLLTTSFWQWLSVTPLQMVTAISTIANWWKLMKPTLLKKVVDINWGIIFENTPKIIRQVISEKTSAKLISMMVSVVKWQAREWWVDWYKVAWKTWTAQISCEDSNRCTPWTYEPNLPWSFITSFWWFAPAENPKFVILVKIDRPRVSKTNSTTQIFWSNTAWPIHWQITKFLLEYYWVKKKSEK